MSPGLPSDSGEIDASWLGDLPEGWERLPLKRVCVSIRRGVTPAYASRGVPVLNQGCVHWDGLDFAGLRFHEATSAPLHARLEPGDVLVNSTGAGTLGRAAVFDVQAAEPYLADSHVTVVRPGPRLEPRFLKYCLEARGYRSYVEEVLASGATRQIELSREGLRQMPVPVPPIAVQRALADHLDEKAERIADFLEREEKLREMLEKYHEDLVAALVTRGLDPEAPRRAAGRWLGEIPAHWRVVPLMYLADPDRSITYGLLQPGRNSPGGVPLVKAGHLGSGEIVPLAELPRTSKKIADRRPRGRLAAGDLVMAIRGSVGAVARVPPELDGACITQDVARIPAGPEIDPVWLLAVLRSRPIQSQVTARALGATVKGLNLRDLRRLVLPVPPLAEQRRLGAHLEGAWSEKGWKGGMRERQRRVLAWSRKIRRQLHEYREALIDDAVRGRLDPARREPVELVEAGLGSRGIEIAAKS